jgi:hypothetical protein
MTKEKILQGIKDLFPVLTIVGIIVGAIGGYLYYAKVGCVSGTCPLTSNPWISTLWGALIGYLIGDMFRKKKPVSSEKKVEL